MDDGKTCHETDECLDGSHKCAHKCANAVGGYQCSCKDGFTLSSLNPRECDDIDECLLGKEVTQCSSVCTNIPGSFICGCLSGYKPSADLLTCDDINECEEFDGICEHVCENTGSSYICACEDGWLLQSDGKSCTGDKNVKSLGVGGLSGIVISCVIVVVLVILIPLITMKKRKHGANNIKSEMSNNQPDVTNQLGDNKEDEYNTIDSTTIADITEHSYEMLNKEGFESEYSEIASVQK